jgi:hypothetical protein
MRRNACNEYLLDYVERQPPDRGNKSLVGRNVGSKALALYRELVDCLLQIGDFIVQTFQSESRLDEEVFNLDNFLILGTVVCAQIARERRSHAG